MKIKRSQIAGWNRTREIDQRAKAEERKWKRGLQNREEGKKPNLDGWELEHIILEHGCLIYRSTEYMGVRGQPMEDQDVGF